MAGAGVGAPPCGKGPDVLPTDLAPMLATPGPLPHGTPWAYEVKWDGVRALLAVDGGTVRATSRNGNDITAAYPELQRIACTPALLDGEVVALVDGVPDFGALQSRMHVRSPSPVLVASTPVVFVPFDVLHLAGRFLLDEPYDARRALLEALPLQVPPAFHDDPDALLASTRAQGLEGLVAKLRTSCYSPGRRSAHWVKVKHQRRQSVVVCGWTDGAGGRAGSFGALLLGVHGPDGLVDVGRVGTGFTSATLHLLQDLLAPLARPTPPYDGPAPRGPAHWVEPVLVVDVELTAWTSQGRLRHPSYKGLRGDLDPSTVVREP